MKNWTDFLPKKSHLLAKNGKILACLEFDVIVAENKLKNCTIAWGDYEMELRRQALLNNTLEQINEAKKKCIEWNNKPIVELINPNKKK